MAGPLTRTERNAIYHQAATIATQAAQQFQRNGDPCQRADIAAATADTLRWAAYLTGNPHLHKAADAWLAFAFLASLIVADNLLWRIASWVASYTFVRVTGDMRRDLFRHLTGHAPSYFNDRMPGTLASRITATSNAVFTLENMFVWNVLPPCAATVAAIIFIGTVSVPMAAGLCLVAAIIVSAANAAQRTPNRSRMRPVSPCPVASPIRAPISCVTNSAIWVTRITHSRS